MRVLNISSDNPEYIVRIRNIYRLVRILSLDIVAGVVAGSFFAAHIMNARLPWTYLVVIALTSWLVYLTDHLIDGLRKGEDTRYEVHRLFYRYKTPVILFILVAGIFDFRLVLYTLPAEILQLGLITGGATLLYLMFTIILAGDVKILFVKELWITLIYTIAIWGGPVIYGGNTTQTWQVAVMISYGLLVLANVLLYSYFEYDKDMADREHTFAVDFGTSVARIVIVAALVLSFTLLIINLVIFGKPDPVESIILGLMTAGLVSLVSIPRWFKDSESYGIFADALFLLPFLSLV